MRTKLLKLGIITSFFLVPILLNAQEVKMNADSLLNIAQQEYWHNENDKSIVICNQILAQLPNYTDANLLLARNLMATQRFDDARTILYPIIKSNPRNHEAQAAMVDLNYWSKNYEKCISCSDSALLAFPSDSMFKAKKQKCIDESVTRMNNMMKSMYELSNVDFKNKISASYSYAYYISNGVPTEHLAYLEYGHNFEDLTWILRYDYANRFNIGGSQIESDIYLKLDPKNYIYANAGVSDNTVFPYYRLGADFYHVFPAKWETSIGFRYLNFDTNDALIYTASATKYFSKYMLGGRIYVTPQSNATAVSGLLNFRYYSSNENYVGLRLKYGISPDNSSLNVNSKLMQSNGIEGEYSELINKRWEFKLFYGFETNEWQPNRFRDAFTGQVILSYLF